LATLSSSARSLIAHISTLVEDIHALFDEKPHECDAERVAGLGYAISRTVERRLMEERSKSEFTLRMSNLGKPDRQLWYEKHLRGSSEPLGASQKIKFLFGDILEHLLLFLSKEAGHEVTHEQEKIDVDGIAGSMDAVIDGVVVDTKSASSIAFRKFKEGRLTEDDPFGYMEQLAGYSAGVGERDGAFLVIDKTLGHICLDEHPKEELQALKIRERINHMRDVLDQPEPPERCYAPVPKDKSGNLALAIGCAYCPFKHECWKDANDGIGLRTFLYSQGPVHLVHVEQEPKVMEVTF
jgi:hypothetical protein